MKLKIAYRPIEEDDGIGKVSLERDGELNFQPLKEKGQKGKRKKIKVIILFLNT